MNLAEILALPVQTKPQCLFAEDVGDWYGILAGDNGSAAKPFLNRNTMQALMSVLFKTTFTEGIIVSAQDGVSETSLVCKYMPASGIPQELFRFMSYRDHPFLLSDYELTAARTYVWPDADGVLVVADADGIVRGPGGLAMGQGSDTLCKIIPGDASILFRVYDALGTTLNGSLVFDLGGGSYQTVISQGELTANRTMGIPDRDGMIGVVPSYADSTAATAAVSVGDAWWDTTLKKVRVRLS